ncbi:MAG: hypothetical protein GC178_17645 [Flavobacteriales bacterium]|nr:hypothetical protein [Flavobacteriales bacterium]
MRITDAGNVLVGASSSSTNDLYLADRLIDWDNTGYYIDINSSARMNEITFDDGSTSDPSVNFAGDVNTGLFQPADNQMGVTINGTERMRFSDVGNIGIGTTTPSAKLDVRPLDGAASYQFASSANDYPRLYMGGASTSVAFVINRLTTSATQYFGEDSDAGGFQFRGTGATRIGSLSGSGIRSVTVDASGNLGTGQPTSGSSGFWSRNGADLYPTNVNDYVGIGNTNPAYDLDVNGYIRLSTNVGINTTPRTDSYRLSMGGHIHMNNNEVNYANQVHFNDNLRFVDEGNSSYLRYRYGNTTAGGIKVYDGNDALQGYLYASGDNVNFGLLDADGNWAVRVYRDNSVMLYDDNQYTFGAGQGAISGDYGTVQTQSDGGKGGWEGYNIDGRFALMSDGTTNVGLYNDVNNRWIMLHARNSWTRFYEPDATDYIYINTNTDLVIKDNNLYDVNNLTTNTIYDEEDNRVDIIDYVWFDNPSSGYDMWFDSYGSDPHLRSGSAGWGYIGRVQNWWRYVYATSHITMSQRDLKRDIHPVESNGAIKNLILTDIDRMKPSLYKYKTETDDLIEGSETSYRPQYHLGFILDETPDYLQDNEFGGIDNYALASMSMVGVKQNREDIKALKEGRGQNKISDFGSGTVDGESLWVDFDPSFIEQLSSGQVPVVSVTPNALGAEMAVVEKNANGFRVRKVGSNPLDFDWIAMAKVNNKPAAQKEQLPEIIPQNMLDQLIVPQSAKEKSKLIPAADKMIHERLEATPDAPTHDTSIEGEFDMNSNAGSSSPKANGLLKESVTPLDAVVPAKSESKVPMRKSE